jgi:hypothetical protein
MFGTLRRLIRRSPLVPPEEAKWQLDCFEWLLRGSGGFGRFRRSLLVLPTDEFFPQRGLPPGTVEAVLFEQIKRHAGMEGWKCKLEVQAEDPDPHVAPTIVVQGAPRSPLGTFQRSPTSATITYGAGLISNPMSFVATVAHELGHLLISDIAEPIPGGETNLEFLTDLAAVFLGFGVFLVNSAFTFSQFDGGATIGWSARRQGYLSEPQLLNALSIFTVLLKMDPRRVEPHLKGQFRGLYRAACMMNAESEKVTLLRAAPPVQADTRSIVPRSPQHLV